MGGYIDMKDIYKKGTIIAIILLSIIFIYSYFNVKGNEIISVSNLSLTSSVTITKADYFLDEEEIYDLDTEQIGLLKSLISSSNFTRTLSSSVRSYDKDTYVIFISNNSQDFQTIKCIGNEYIEVIHQFNGKYLKINNKAWKNELERIISLTE